MTKEDAKEIERLKKLTRVGPKDKMSAQKMVQKYVNSGLKYCLQCAPQVRQLWQKLKNIDTTV